MAWRSRQLWWLVAALVLLGATFSYPNLELPRLSYRYVYVFDISQSMNVIDTPSAANGLSRLEFAKQAATESLSELPCGSEVGLALFTGHRAFLLTTPIEVCANYRELAGILANIDWRMTWEARSEIAKGIFKTIKLLREMQEITRLVFFTDGHEAPPLNPEIPPSFRGKKGAVDGLIVGVGGDDAVPIPKFSWDGESQGVWQADEVEHIDSYTQQRNAREGKESNVVGTEHLSSLREDYLQSLTDATGLRYVRLSNTRSFVKAVRTRALGIPRIRTSDVRWLFAGAALFALFMSMRVRDLPLAPKQATQQP